MSYMRVPVHLAIVWAAQAQTRTKQNRFEQTLAKSWLVLHEVKLPIASIYRIFGCAALCFVTNDP